MQKKIQKTDKEFLFFQDFWKFHLMYYQPKDKNDDQFFEELIQKSDELYRKYKDEPFEPLVKGMILAHTNFAESQIKKGM